MKFSKKSLAALAIAGAMVFGVGAGYGTYAYFTSNATSANNVISTGTVEMNVADGTDGEIIQGFTIAGITPGYVSPPQVVTVTNNGSLEMKCRLRISDKTDGDNILYDGIMTNPDNTTTDVGNQLQVQILLETDQVDETSGEKIYTSVQDWTYIDELLDVQLNTFNSSQSKTYKIKYRLPVEAGNEYQGKTGTFTFNFDATQTTRTDNGWDE